MSRTMNTLMALLLGAWCGLAIAGPNTEGPEKLVRQTTEEVLSVLKEENRKGRKDPALAEKLVNEKMLPLIDFQTFSKLTLGTHWQTATPDQRTRFTREFQSMLIRRYAKDMLDYADAKVKYLPSREEEKYVFVNTELIPGQGKNPLHVSFRFKRMDEAWKAIDVTVDGLSMAKNFRTSFTEEVNQTGLDALIQRLASGNVAGLVTLPDKK